MPGLTGPGDKFRSFGACLMINPKRLGVSLAAVLLASGGLTVAAAAAPAFAREVVCNPGEQDVTFANKATPWVINNHVSISNWQAGSFTHSETETKTTEITSGITVETGGKVSASDIISSMEASFSVSVASAGSTIGSTSVTDTITAAPYTYDVFFHAAHEVSATYTASVCNAAQTGWTFESSGVAKSWSSTTVGGVNCPGSQGYRAPASGTAPAAALPYCP